MQEHTTPTCPTVSVIIPVFENAAGLRVCLDALSRQTVCRSRYEVIVVDNGSHASIECACRPYSGVIFSQEERRGSYAARNKGILLSQGQILAFTDSDCIPEPDWIERGVARLAAADGCAIVAGNIRVFLSDPSNPSSVELYESVFAFDVRRYVAVDKFGPTANLWTSRAVVDAIGPFNERLKSGGDFEWGQRAFHAGFIPCFAEDVIVRHPARRTFAELDRKLKRVAGGHHALRAVWWRRLAFALKRLAPPVRQLRRLSRHGGLTGSQKVRVAVVLIRSRLVAFSYLLKAVFGGEASR